MAASIPDDDYSGDTPMERAAAYWKKAAEMYRLACSAESEEVKRLYMGVAMSWAALAHELEQGPPTRALEGHASWAKH
jgi:hypothetical protein